MMLKNGSKAKPKTINTLTSSKMKRIKFSKRPSKSKKNGEKVRNQFLRKEKNNLKKPKI